MKEMDEGTYGDGGRWSRHLMGGNHQDKCQTVESFILNKIRSKGREDNTHSSSHNISPCKIQWVGLLFIGEGALKTSKRVGWEKGKNGQHQGLTK